MSVDKGVVWPRLVQGYGVGEAGPWRACMLSRGSSRSRGHHTCLSSDLSPYYPHPITLTLLVTLSWPLNSTPLCWPNSPVHAPLTLLNTLDLAGSSTPTLSMWSGWVRPLCAACGSTLPQPATCAADDHDRTLDTTDYHAVHVIHAVHGSTYMQ
jgi:hypothetical protein